eukprot:13491942-Alexandrium_andersonii.AAC.1
MSASLVGSEMCIRDRGGSTSSSESRLFDPARCPDRNIDLGSLVSKLCDFCLLYTSDAADDM